MAKRNLKKEKAIRNEYYAKKWKKDDEEEENPHQKKKAKYDSWCRVKSHPAECSCVFTYGEIEMIRRNWVSPLQERRLNV